MTCVWGVDVSTKRIALASSTGACTSIDLPDLKGCARLSEARTMVFERTQGFAAFNPPTCVWVEAPAGKPRPHLSLISMCAVTIEAIYTALLPLNPHPTWVYEIPVATWKKHSVGHGNATKDEVMEWAQGFADPANQDEADSFGVAIAGEVLTTERKAA